MNTPLQTLAKIPSKPGFTPTGLLQRKCACGNHAMGGECEECGKQKRLGLQTKLKINEPGDRYEQEADRIAAQVMAMPAPQAASSVPSRIQGFSGEMSGQPDAVPDSVHQTLASPGKPLDPATRAFFEPRFGHDFSQVRVHTSAGDAKTAEAVGARAFTTGESIVFGAGQYVPGTTGGRRLLAHELTHTLQQNHQAHSSIQRSPDEVGLPDSIEPSVQIEPNIFSGEPLPYRQASELLECIRIMGEENAPFCRQEVLGEPPGFSRPPSLAPTLTPFGVASGKTARVRKMETLRGCAYTITYANPRQVDCDTVFRNEKGRNPPEPLCGVSLVYDITSVSAAGSKCPKLDGLKVSEIVKGDQGCAPPGFVWPAPNPCVIGAGGKVSNCTDTFTICGPTKNLQGNGCTEIVDQEIEVGGQLAEEHEIIFKLKKSSKGCAGSVTRN